MSSRKVLLFFVMFFFLTRAELESQQSRESLFPVKVSVVVESSGNTLASNALRGFLYKKLREIDGVKIVTKHPDWSIHFLTTESYSNKDNFLGYIHSYVFIFHWNCSVQERTVNEAYGHYLGASGDRDEVYDYLESVVHSFDSTCLEWVRELEDNK